MQILNNEAIGKKLHELRGEKPIKEVATALGVTEQAVWLYESGKRIPSDTMKIKIADYYNKSVEDLFYAEKVNL